jgi:F-type H+-transporting ATPase subunit epsilon
MKLLITTPTAIVVDEPAVVAIRAEDESGGFGILSGHADFLTVLALSVISWRRADDRAFYCAVRHGVLSVSGGNLVEVATREAVQSDDLDRLDQVVITEFKDAMEAERTSRSESMQLELRAIRQIVRFLRPRRADGLGDGL